MMKEHTQILVLLLLFLAAGCAKELPRERAEKLTLPEEFKAIDAPNDDGSAVLLVWSVSPSDNIRPSEIEKVIKEKTKAALKLSPEMREEIIKRVSGEVKAHYARDPVVTYTIWMSKSREGEWSKIADVPSNSSFASEDPKYFGYSGANEMLHFLEVTKPYKELKDEESRLTELIIISNTQIGKTLDVLKIGTDQLKKELEENEKKRESLIASLEKAPEEEIEKLKEQIKSLDREIQESKAIIATPVEGVANRVARLEAEVKKARGEREEVRKKMKDPAELTYYFKLEVTDGKETLTHPEIVTALPVANLFNWARLNNFVLVVLFSVVVMALIGYAKRNPHLFIRKISGLDAVDEAVGRATEMGRPILYFMGLHSMGDLPTIASANILGRVARKVAQHDSQIKVPCYDPIVMSVCQEVVKEAYTAVGRPDAYRQENIFFVSNEQFSYTAAADGMMMRDKPATNFFLGYFYAEALLLTEAGAGIGAIQIAGTDALHQLPFFVTTCDYTLIGEELYAASAYLSREPVLLGSLKGQDAGKLFLIVLVIVGTVLSSIGIDYLTRIFEPL